MAGREKHLANARRQDRPRPATPKSTPQPATSMRGRVCCRRRLRCGGPRGVGEPPDLLAQERPAEIRHRPPRLEHRLFVVVHAVQQEHPLLEAGEQPVEPAAIERPARRRRRPFEPVEHAGLVPRRLQAAEEPDAGVGKPLVVEIDRILRGEHHAEAEGTGLLEEREDRPLAWRIGRGRHVAKHLVHEEQRLERRRAALRAHP